jgi:hypothetical protein
MCQAALEKAEEDEELGLCSKGWREVLQFDDECCGIVGAILQV